MTQSLLTLPTVEHCFGEANQARDAMFASMGGLHRLEKLLTLLADGSSHKVAELAAETGWPLSRTRFILEFLSAHGLVSYRRSDQTARIDEQLKSLLIESWNIDR